MLQEHNFETDLIEALMTSSEGGHNPLTGTKLAFFLATVAMLKEHHDATAFKDGLSIYWRAAERLGLVQRDGKGMFDFDNEGDQPSTVDKAMIVMSAFAAEDDERGQVGAAENAEVDVPVSSSIQSAQAEDGEEGHTAAADKAKSAVPSSPSPAYLAAEIEERQERYRKAFAFRMGEGRSIGEFRYSELSRCESESVRDAKIFRAVREYAVPAGDPLVADYFPGARLETILSEVRKNAHN